MTPRTISTLRILQQHHVKAFMMQRTMSSVSSSTQAKEDHTHCVDLVRERDMEGYLCGLLMPSSARNSYFAIRAFNVEIASIKDGGAIKKSTQSGSNIASNLRMQWWRDVISDIYTHPSDKKEEETLVKSSSNSTEYISQSIAASRKQNPIVRSLQSAIHSSNLTKRFLDRMMEAREEDLDVKQMKSMEDLVQYGEDTTSSFLYLSLECAGVRDSNADQCASHIGVAHGLVTSLRSTLYKSSRGELSIPDDLMRKYSVPSRYLLDPPTDRYDIDENNNNATNDYTQIKKEYKESDDSLRKAVQEIAFVSRAHLHEARNKQNMVPKDGRQALLPAVSALHYLEMLEKVNYDVLHPMLNAAPEAQRLNVALLLGRAWLTGVF
mmetsp:Transcript_39871/g.58233  ORF Transcript_39871/g.58233 Transcript_39871/m.58233 type:complete len:380 (-) Transcript_39871:61-1200(-)